MHHFIKLQRPNGKSDGHSSERALGVLIYACVAEMEICLLVRCGLGQVLLGILTFTGGGSVSFSFFNS